MTFDNDRATDGRSTSFWHTDKQNKAFSRKKNKNREKVQA